MTSSCSLSDQVNELSKLTAVYIPKHSVQFIETDQFKQAVNWDSHQLYIFGEYN